MGTHDVRAPRFGELDALRGLAALGVLVYHFTGHFDDLYGHTPELPVTFGPGNYGVHLFFVISGFVIFMTLDRTERALDFVVSRFSRLFPAYWAALAVTLLAGKIAGLPGQEISTHDAFVNLTMLSDFFGAREADGSYWTLQVELFFYAQMLFWYAVGGFRHIRLIIVAWLLLAALYGIQARYGVSLSYTLRELLIARFIPFFAAGILLYRIYHTRDSWWRSAPLLAACVLSAWAIWSWMEATVLTLSIATFGLFILGKLKLLARQPFVFLGTVSFTIYLVHQNIGFIVIAHLERAGLAPWASILIATAAVVALACALTFAVERPAMRAIRAGYRRWRERPSTRAARGSI